MDVPSSNLPPPSSSAALARSGRRSWLQYAFIGLLFAAVLLALWRGWSQLDDFHWQLNQGAALLALGLWVVATLGAGGCWLVVTRIFGAHLPTGLALRVFCTSNLGKYLPGKVLHVFARVYLLQQQGVPLAVGTTSTVLDVLLYIAAGLVLSVFALPIALGGDDPPVMAIAAVATMLGVALLHPRALNRVLAFAGRFVPRLRGLRIELSYVAILGAFVLYLLLWLVVTAAVYAGVRAVAYVPPASAPLLGAVFAFSYITGLITPTPAGVGGREAAMAWLFTAFMPFPAALVATVLNRLLQVSAEAVCAGLLGLLVRK
jgi:uncharacterized membrane protein YbhN (UPF0104 family)